MILLHFWKNKKVSRSCLKEESVWCGKPPTGQLCFSTRHCLEALFACCEPSKFLHDLSWRRVSPSRSIIWTHGESVTKKANAVFQHLCWKTLIGFSLPPGIKPSCLITAWRSDSGSHGPPYPSALRLPLVQPHGTSLGETKPNTF